MSFFEEEQELLMEQLSIRDRGPVAVQVTTDGLGSSWTRLRVAWTRLKAKSFRQLVRLVCLRVWPLSILGQVYYRYHYSPRRHERLNRRGIELLVAQRKELADRHAVLVKQLREEGAVVTHLNEVIPNASVSKLAEHAEKLLHEPKSRTKIENRMNRDDAKWYVVRSLPR